VHASREPVFVDGHPGSFDAEIVLGSSLADQNPPSISSLRVLNANGAATDHLANGEASTLRLTVSDIRQASNGPQFSPVDSGVTSVAYRVRGSAAWRSLPVVVESREYGPASSFDHTPAGDIDHVDLSEVTANANSMIDLQITVGDPAGNKLIWTLSPALIVGDVPSPPRRRVAR